MSAPIARVLVIAGSDSCGGAGLQADIKTVTALGGYASSAVTAVTVQDRKRVHAIIDIAPEVVAEQIRVIAADVGADCVKTGMLATAEIVETVAETLAGTMDVMRVVDPVMVSSGGDRLIPKKAEEALRSLMISGSFLTPNAPEAACLTGRDVTSLDDQRHAADHLLEAGATAVLVKGGHIGGAIVSDVLAYGGGEHVLRSPRIGEGAPHGTGCTLASAIAVCLARGDSFLAACETARTYLHQAIRRSEMVSPHGVLLYHGWKAAPCGGHKTGFWEDSY